MAFEVHTGSRPGRPRLMLVISAGVLATSLGLAWYQVHAHRALGPRRSIPGTPLSVRVPLGWQQDENDPGRFVLPTQSSRRRALFEVERSIQIDYAEQPHFIAPFDLLQVPEFVGPGRVSQIRQVRIGDYHALQVLRRQPQSIGRTVFERETILRFTCLPRGQIIKIVYEPLVSLRPADIEILEDVCASLQVSDPTLSGSAEEHLAAAGLELPLQENWSIVGPAFAEVPGLYLGGLTQDGPAFSLALLRTWLSDGRAPADLLTDLAAEHWSVWEPGDLVREVSRPDGTSAWSLRHPAFGQTAPDLCSAWLIAPTATEALMLLVYASAERAETADETAARIATGVRILPLAPFTALNAAQARGRQLVHDLHQAGPRARWGREPVEVAYQRQGTSEVVVSRRAAVARDPSQGYRGEQLFQRSRGRQERVVWNMSADARVYDWVADLYIGRDSLSVSEVRSDPDAPVQRRLTLDRRQQRWRYEPGPAFVPPPAERIVSGWVARDAQPALVHVSSLQGPSTHALLLRPLPPQEDQPRVLVQQDFWPVGRIEVYDDALGIIEREINPGAIYIRID